MNTTRDIILKVFGEFVENLKIIFNEQVEFKANLSDDKKWQIKVLCINGNLELDVWFYDVGETYDYSLNNKRNQEPVIRINWLEVSPQKSGFGKKVWREFISTLPEKAFKRILLDANDEAAFAFWKSQGFIQVGQTNYMFKDLY